MQPDAIDALYVELLNLVDSDDWVEALSRRGLKALLDTDESDLISSRSRRGYHSYGYWYARTLGTVLERLGLLNLAQRIAYARGIRRWLLVSGQDDGLDGTARADTLRAWAAEHQLGDLADRRAASVIPESVIRSDHAGLDERSLADLFDMRRSTAQKPPTLYYSSTVVAPDTLERVARWLNRMPANRTCTRAFLRRLATAWPDDADVDAAMGGLREGLLALPDSAVPFGPLAHASHGVQTFDRTGWSLRIGDRDVGAFRPRPTPDQQSLELDAFDREPPARAPFAAMLCDLIFIEEVRETLHDHRADWVPPALTRSEPEPTSIGYRLGSRQYQADLQVVFATPQKNGFRLKKTEIHPVLPRLDLTAIDRRVLRLMELSRVLGQSPIEQAEALYILIGHPRVFPTTKARMPVPVRAIEVRLELSGDNRWGRASWTDGTRRWSHRDFQAALAWPISQAQPVAVLVGADRIDVFRAEPAWIRVFDWVSTADGWIPPGSVQPLIEKLDGVETVDLALSPELEGRQLTPDATPHLRLESTDGGVHVSFEVRPLPGGRHLPAGDGPKTLRGRDADGRWTLMRDLPGERAKAQAKADALGLVDTTPKELHLDAAVDLLSRLDEVPDLIQARWSGPRTSLSTASASSVRIELAGDRMMSLGGEIQVDGTQLPVADVLRALRDGHRFVRLDKRRIARLKDDLGERLQMLADMTWTTRGGEEELGATAAPAIDALEALGVKVDAPSNWGTRIQAMRAASLSRPELPTSLRATLRPYQEEGVIWALRLCDWGLGAVLADDMGLGKTLQALAVLLARSDRGRALVVAPTSVIGTWQREASRFAPDLDIHVYHGARRAKILDEAGPRQVLLTSWGTLAQDAETLALYTFRTVVLDEAHAIKNPSTRRAAAARALQADFVLALTGTPIENHPTELWSLMRVVTPGLLGPREAFEARFARPIVGGTGADVQARLGRIVRPFLLRRTKAEVATELPPREEIEIPITLTEPERAIYEGLRRAGLGELEGVDEETASAIQILAVLTRLRQTACHAGLVVPEIDDSSKLRAVRRSLRDLRESGHRALVFSQFTSLLDVLAEQLLADGFRVGRLDGRHSRTAREASVAAFQSGELDVFLLSLKAGGVGITLTAASYVLHLDPWWNPAVQDQATDRAHRIGQDQPVTVLHYIAQDTVEVGIRRLQEQKRALVDGLLQGAGAAGRMDAAALLRLVRLGGLAAGSDLVGDVLLGPEDPDEPRPETAPPPASPDRAPPQRAEPPMEPPAAVPWSRLFDAYMENVLDRVSAGRLKMSSAMVYKGQASRLVELLEGRPAPRDRRDLADALAWAEAEYTPQGASLNAWRRVAKDWTRRLPEGAATP